MNRTHGPTFVCLLAAIAVALPGCLSDEPDQDFQVRDDMYVQPSFRHNEDPRPQPEGTMMTLTGVDIAPDSAAFVLLKNPYAFQGLSLDTAKTLFMTYCSPCHGPAGRGDGPVAAKFQTPPDLTLRRFRDLTDGTIAYVARNGYRLMPPHREMTTGRERWMIVTHIRRLQE